MDLYAVLGVDKSAGIDQIRSAYRKLALSLHPDRNPGDQAKENRFKDVSRAYEILSDDAKRARYDLERANPGRIPVPTPFFRSGRGGFSFTGQVFTTATSPNVSAGQTVEIRVGPQMAGQTVPVFFNGQPMPGVFVFVRRG